MRFTVICTDLSYEVMPWNETNWLAASGNNNQVFCLIWVRKFLHSYSPTTLLKEFTWDSMAGFRWIYWVYEFCKVMLNHTLQLLQQHSFIVEESLSWTDRPAVKTFHHLKHLTHREKKKIWQWGLPEILLFFFLKVLQTFWCFLSIYR